MTVIGTAVLAVACWLARGALAVEGPGPASPRIGLLPPWWQLAALVAVAVGIALSGRFSRTRAPALLTAFLVILPWLPVPVPAAFLIWTGPMAWLIVLATVLTTALAAPWRSMPARLRSWASDPLRAPIAAMVIAGMLYGAAAWQLSPRLPGGDEPHYLIITQSLLNDGDVQIENNHVRGDYRAYFANELKPDYLRRGLNGQIYSVHAPGLSALVAPAFLAGGYPGVIAFLILLSAAASALVWKIGLEVTGSIAAAWFAWAAVSLSAPFFFHAFTIYPDGPAAAVVLTGVWALVRARPADDRRAMVAWHLHGAALALLPWLHTRYALLAAVLGVALLVRIAREPLPLRRATGFLLIPVLSAASWFWFFYAIYGQFSPAAPYGHYTQSEVAFIATGLPGLLFDQQFGLLANAPILALAVPGLWWLSRHRNSESSAEAPWRFGVSLALVALVLPYLAMAGAYRMWWGGASAPARFAVPIVLALGAPLAALWPRARAATRAVALALLGVSLAITAILAWAGSGALLFNVRDGAALWLKWVSPLANLTLAMPSFFRDSRDTGVLHAAIWVAMLTLAWAALRLFERRGANRGRLASATPLALAAASMMAATTGWALSDAPSIAPAPGQAYLLAKYDPLRRPIGLRIPRLTMLDAVELPGRLIVPSGERPGSAEQRPLFTAAWLPAGRYQLDAGRARVGMLAVRVGRGPGPVQQIDLAQLPPRVNAEITLPIDVSALVIDGDAAARKSVAALALRPTVIVAPSARLDPRAARQSARYGTTVVYSLDPRAYLESAGIWTMGGSETWMVVQPDAGSTVVRLFVKNAPVANHLRADAGEWRRELALKAGEEQMLEVPVSAVSDPLDGDPTHPGALLIKLVTETGFRPAEVDPQSKDTRLLGCWIEIR